MDVVGSTDRGKTVVGVNTFVVLTRATIRLVLISVVASALHIGTVAVGQDTSYFRSGEEDVGERRLSTLRRGISDDTLIKALLVCIHELYPDFLDGTILAKVKLIISLEKTRDCEHTSTNTSGVTFAPRGPM